MKVVNLKTMQILSKHKKYQFKGLRYAGNIKPVQKNDEIDYETIYKEVFIHFTYGRKNFLCELTKNLDGGNSAKKFVSCIPTETEKEEYKKLNKALNDIMCDFLTMEDPAFEIRALELKKAQLYLEAKIEDSNKKDISL